MGDGENFALNIGAVEGVKGSLGVFGELHFDKAKTTRLPSVGIKHDFRLVYFAIFTEEVLEERDGDRPRKATNVQIVALVRGFRARNSLLRATIPHGAPAPVALSVPTGTASPVTVVTVSWGRRAVCGVPC